MALAALRWVPTGAQHEDPHGLTTLGPGKATAVPALSRSAVLAVSLASHR